MNKEFPSGTICEKCGGTKKENRVLNQSCNAGGKHRYNEQEITVEVQKFYQLTTSSMDKIKESLMEVDYVWSSREDNRLMPQVEEALTQSRREGMEEAISLMDWKIGIFAEAQIREGEFNKTMIKSYIRQFIKWFKDNSLDAAGRKEEEEEGV